jgi:hypothetical protein
MERAMGIEPTSEEIDRPPSLDALASRASAPVEFSQHASFPGARRESGDEPPGQIAENVDLV